MRKLFLIGAIIVAGFMSLSAEAIAQAVATAPLDDQVVIPWGEWVSSIALLVAASAAAIVAFSFRFLPAEWQAMARTARVDQLLEKAIQYGANTTAGATVNMTMTVPVASDVVEGGLEYALTHAPSLVKWAGGPEALRQKIIARLDIEKDGAIPG